MPIDDATLWQLCRDKSFRHQFAWMVLGRGLARQIHVMRRARGWSQKELAQKAGISQARIAVLEQWCGNASIKTLLRIANVFDVALMIRFVAWGEFFLSLSSFGANVLSFDQELALLAPVTGETASPSEKG